VFFLSSSSSSYLWYLFSRIRAMIESNRGRFMYLHTVVVVLVLYGMLLSSSSSSFTWHARKKL